MQSLARILIEDILTFAYSDESQINEEFSVNQLERIAKDVISFDDKTLCEFQIAVKNMAEEAKARGWEERAKQIELIPLHLGLI